MWRAEIAVLPPVQVSLPPVHHERPGSRRELPGSWDRFRLHGPDELG